MMVSNQRFYVNGDLIVLLLEDANEVEDLLQFLLIHTVDLLSW